MGTGVLRRRRPKNGADSKSARGARAMRHGRATWHGTPVPPGTAVSGRRLEMAARVRVNVGFWKVAARVVKGETLPHRPYIKGVKDLVSIINQKKRNRKNTLRE